MAIRPVFVVGADNIEEKQCEFKWYAGFSKIQKQKSINSLHNSFLRENNNKKILEISTSSKDELGRKLSAFNLMIKDKHGNYLFSVESLFQSSKKFTNGGPYLDIRNKPSKEAKKDLRLKRSGKLISFCHKGEEWGLEPKTHFYDWIYINTIHQYNDLREEILEYDAFTDIEFNPKKSVNCQANSAALYVLLRRMNKFEEIIQSKNKYIEFIKYLNNKQISFDIH